MKGLESTGGVAYERKWRRKKENGRKKEPAKAKTNIKCLQKRNIFMMILAKRPLRKHCNPGKGNVHVSQNALSKSSTTLENFKNLETEHQ